MCHTCVYELVKTAGSFITASPKRDMNRVPETRCRGINLHRSQSVLKQRLALRVTITLDGSPVVVAS